MYLRIRVLEFRELMLDRCRIDVKCERKEETPRGLAVVRLDAEQAKRSIDYNIEVTEFRNSKITTCRLFPPREGLCLLQSNLQPYTLSYLRRKSSAR